MSDLVVDVRFGLPASWWLIPLGDAGRRRAAIAALVEQQFRGIDDQPLLKADTRRQLEQSAERSAQACGRLLAVSLQRVAGMPIPASLVVTWIAAPPSGEDGASPFADACEQARSTDDESDVAQIPAGPVLRQVRTRTGTAETGSEQLTSLQASYTLDRPDGLGLVQLAFSTPLAEHRVPMLVLFDAVVDSVTWVTAAEQSRDAALDRRDAESRDAAGTAGDRGRPERVR